MVELYNPEMSLENKIYLMLFDLDSVTNETSKSVLGSRLVQDIFGCLKNKAITYIQEIEQAEFVKDLIPEKPEYQRDIREQERLIYDFRKGLESITNLSQSLKSRINKRLQLITIK